MQTASTWAAGWAAALVAAGLFATASTAVAQSGAPEDASSPAPAPTAAELLHLADEVLAAIQQQRGVLATEPVLRDVQGRDALRERLSGLLTVEYTPAELAATDRMLKALGLIAADTDYTELMLDLLVEQVAGFYDDRTKVFYLLDDMPASMQPGIMSHELFHALQDQRWGIDRIRGRSDRVTDVALARTALIEGDALAVMIQFSAGGAMAPWDVPMLDTLMASSMPTAAEGSDVAIPQVLWEQLLFPYTGGLSLVAERGRAGGWPAVDAMYTDLPASTEQVLHPARYAERDDPTWLEFDVAAALPDAERYAVDVIGELTLRATLTQLLQGQVAASACERAASGWDGDRLELWAVGPERNVAVWLQVWDTESDAHGFFAVANRLGSAWMPDASGGMAAAGDGEAGIWWGADGVVLAERWGDLTLVVSDRGGSAPDREASVQAVREAVWATMSRAGYPDAL